ncbi:MAG: Peptidase family protein [Candidatus Saccharibacteria bacterium]|nr:Peptidase family protein [Candidatus Saccharibacteria bacterium]
MNETLYEVTHYYQPTNNTCGYAALAILLSYYGKKYKPEELVDKVPQPKDAEGTSHGSVTAQLADWCQTEGFQVHMYVSDMYILDLSWKDKSSAQIKERLEQVKSKRKISIMDSHWVGIYENAYLTMLDHGADLSVVQFITTELLNELLKKGPIYANICSSASSGKGRTTTPRLHEDVIDDVNGAISTHSVVIYGNNEEGSYLVADPWYGLMVIKPELMVLAIEAAQIECDNQIFVIKES